MKMRLTLLAGFTLLLLSSVSFATEQCRAVGSPSLLPWSYDVTGFASDSDFGGRMDVAFSSAQQDLSSEIDFCKRVCDSVGGKLTTVDNSDIWSDCRDVQSGHIQLAWECTVPATVTCAK